MKTKKAIFVLAAAATAASSVYADKVDLKSAPVSVQDAIKSRAGTRPVEDIDRETRNGQVTYEASWKNASGAQQELLVSENGAILRDVAADASVTTSPQTSSVNGARWRPRYGTADANLQLSNGTKLTLEQAPEAVRTTISRMANGAQIEDLERGTANGRTIYEAAYKVNGQNTELQVYDDGSLVRKAWPGATPGVSSLPSASSVIGWQPRYAGLSDSWVTLSSPKDVSLNQAPRPVQLTLNRMAGGAYISSLKQGTWNGRTIYDARFQQNGQQAQLELLDDGSLITKGPVATSTSVQSSATTPTTKGQNQSFFDRAATWIDRFNNNGAVGTSTASNVGLSQAPAAVQQTMNQQTKGAAVQSLQQENWNGRTLYSATYQQNGQNMKMQVLEDGSILHMGPEISVGGPAGSQTGFGSSR